ncbi:MAG: protein phosphatase 2C domain-containing protein [Thermoguttaceae bacterium]|nr:protein phosphatase 2C domain-containing protein [Thermoguttaceae bacterium]
MSSDDKRYIHNVDDARQPLGISGVLRFTIALQNKVANYDANYYQTHFSDSLRNSFKPNEGEVGRPYSYEFPFDVFLRETKPEEWRFDVRDVRGFDSLGLSVIPDGYRLIIKGTPKVAFDGKIEVKVLPGTTAYLENGSFSFERAFRINGARKTKDRQSYYDDPVMQTTEPSREKPYYVDVIRAQMSRNKYPGGMEDYVSSASLNPNLTLESRQREIIPPVLEPVAPEWKNNPHPLDAPYQVDDQARCAETIDLKTPLTVLAASQRGRSHAHEGKFRDDAFRIAVNREATIFHEEPEYGWHVFVVSDGAGSAKYSRKGAQLICDCVAEKLSNTLNRDVAGQKTTNAIGEWIALKYRAGSLESLPDQTTDFIAECKLDAIFYNALSEAYFEIWKETKRLRDCGEKADVADFSATALCVAIKRFKSENGDWKTNRRVVPPRWAITSYWIGDGAIALYRPNFSCDPNEDAHALKDDLLLLGRPDAGEYAGETRFLTSKGELDSAENVDRNLMNVRKRMTLTVVRSFEALFMATDGVTDPFFEVEKQLADFTSWQRFWNGKFASYFPGVLDVKRTPQERAQALLDGMMFSERGYHDDRTVLMALNDIMVERDFRSSVRRRL